jgi:hypothetical protein
MKTYASPESLAKAAAAWTAAQRLQQFGYGDISFEVTVSVGHATFIVKGWEKDGKVRRIAGPLRGKASKLRFEVVPEHEVGIAPVQGDAYEQMWTAMRKTGAFSPTDISSLCAVPVSVEDAAAYCRALLAGNYLRVVSKAVPGRKEAVYRLFNITGVKAPRERRVRCLVDPNIGKTVPLAEAGL